MYKENTYPVASYTFRKKIKVLADKYLTSDLTAPTGFNKIRCELSHILYYQSCLNCGKEEPHYLLNPLLRSNEPVLFGHRLICK